jgi:hypothetical protein
MGATSPSPSGIWILPRACEGAVSDSLLARHDALETMGDEVHTGPDEAALDTK